MGSGIECLLPGAPRHPVFVALAGTVREFDIPKQTFADLLTAFRQDQTVTRYETFDDLLGYCRYSANPVGHLVLYLVRISRCRAPAAFRFHLHRTATRKFLAGCQPDYEKGRIYCRWKTFGNYGVTEADIAQQEQYAAVRRNDAL